MKYLSLVVVGFLMVGCMSSNNSDGCCEKAMTSSFTAGAEVIQTIMTPPDKVVATVQNISLTDNLNFSAKDAVKPHVKEPHVYRSRYIDYETGESLGGETHCYPVFYVDTLMDKAHIEVLAYNKDSDGDIYYYDKVEIEKLSPWLQLVTIPVGCGCVNELNVTTFFDDTNISKSSTVLVK